VEISALIPHISISLVLQYLQLYSVVVLLKNSFCACFGSGVRIRHFSWPFTYHLIFKLKFPEFVRGSIFFHIVSKKFAERKVPR